MVPLQPSFGSEYPWQREMKSEDRGLYLIHLLLTCANQVANGNHENANFTLDQISQLASPEGDTMQRIASYFSGALADRVLQAWPGIHRALTSTSATHLSDQIEVRKLFFELCPFLKLAFVITNQAILEAMEGEKMIHIIDLNPVEPAQWLALIQSLTSRTDGPPHLRITAIHHHKQVLDQMGQSLSQHAEKLDIPFQFNPILTPVETLDFDKLRVKTGEALAVSSVLKLHTLLASKDPGLPANGFIHKPSKMSAFLTGVCGLSPKLVVITEQHSNHNVGSLMERLLEALYYYAALFDCLESTMSRTSVERMKIERMVFGEEIKNIVACEGEERRERHEKLESWIGRLESCGFWNVPLSYYSLVQGKRVLQSYGCDGFRIKEDNGCVVICWQDRSLFSVSAWRRK